MNTEQIRAEFEAHFSKPPFEWVFHRYGEDSAWPGNYQLYEHQCAWEAYQAGRAALQSQNDTSKLVKRLREADKPLMQQNTFSEVRALLREAADALQSQDREGWKEAAIAWEVCASIHRQYCKGKDPFFKTRQADFVKHAADSRDRAVVDEALQAQERDRLQFVADEGCHFETYEHEDGTCKYRLVWPNYEGWEYQAEWFDTPEEAIDHARRVEGDGDMVLRRAK